MYRCRGAALLRLNVCKNVKYYESNGFTWLDNDKIKLCCFCANFTIADAIAPFVTKAALICWWL